MLIYISGVHSGPSPAPGIGVARCLRQGYPQAQLIAVDYSLLSSGLNWPEFNGFRCFSNWASIDFTSHAKVVRDLVEQGGIWLAVSDCEVRFLASMLPNVRGVPNPPPSAMAFVEKPAAEAAALLQLRVPPWATFENEWDLYSFCRRAGWNVWLKGLRGNAARVESWPKLHAEADKMAGGEGERGDVFVQRHVDGRGEAVAFAAHAGKLLGGTNSVSFVFGGNK